MRGFLTILDGGGRGPRRRPGAGARPPRARSPRRSAPPWRPAGPPADAVPGPEPVERRWPSSRRRFDAGHGGLRGAPKFPSSLPVRLLLRHHRRTGAARSLDDGGPLPRGHGGRRHPRPARRRLPPLLHRRALAGAPLREDALRQRAAGRWPTWRPGRSPGGPALARVARATSTTWCARAPVAGRRLLLRHRRRQRGRGGALLHLDRRRDPRGAGRPRPAASAASTA